MMTYAESIAGAFSKDDCELPHGIIEISEYEKNSDVLKIGHYCKHLYFLVDGAFMGMAGKQPSALGFRTTEKSQIIRISYPANDYHL